MAIKNWIKFKIKLAEKDGHCVWSEAAHCGGTPPLNRLSLAESLVWGNLSLNQTVVKEKKNEEEASGTDQSRAER